MLNNYEGLELNLIKKEVANEALFSMSKDYILNEEVSFNPIVIRNNLKKTKEALNIISKHGRFAFDELKDISDSLNNLNKGFTLTSNELLEVYEHNACVKRIVRYFKQIEELEELEDYTASLFYDDNLMNEINLKIDSNGEVKEDASTKLKTLYDRALEVDSLINEKAKEFIRDNTNSLQESLIYYRNNRACFLIKNTDKNKFDGFTYGNSASGLASYVEPKVLTSLNNEKSDINNDIKEEINKILYNLSLLVLKDAQNFLDNLESLMLLEVYFAKANYGFSKTGVVASIDDELYLKDLAHPLIDDKKVVLNTYSIKKPYRAIVIGGSNTGGKTVSLKNIGVSVLMTYLGIPLIASEAKIPLYDEVYIDINDSQSIIDSLSTFSSRLLSLNNILNHITDRSLVLIDEIASGTDPKEGEALALAIIETLNNCGCNFVITTHYSKVKKYALASKNILLSSQAFDNLKLLPTYKYIENSLGQSNGLEIASRYITNSNLLSRAKTILKENESDEERVLRLLEEERAKLDYKQKELDAMLSKQKELTDKYQKELDNYKAKKASLEKEAQDKIDEYVERQKEKARHIIKKIRKENLKEHEAQKIASELNDLFIDQKNQVINEDIKVGDNVIVLSTSQVGKVETIKDNKVTVIVNGISLKTSLDNLNKTVAPKKEVKKRVDKSFNRCDKEIVLVGKRCEEALELLSKYLDDAYGSNLKSCRIVHGYGTGVLKKAIHEALKKNKIVKSFHLADAYDGGGAITIVEFK